MDTDNTDLTIMVEIPRGVSQRTVLALNATAAGAALGYHRLSKSAQALIDTISVARGTRESHQEFRDGSINVVMKLADFEHTLPTIRIKDYSPGAEDRIAEHVHARLVDGLRAMAQLFKQANEEITASLE